MDMVKDTSPMRSPGMIMKSFAVTGIVGFPRAQNIATTNPAHPPHVDLIGFLLVGLANLL